MIHLDSSHPSAQFDEHHLQLLTAVGTIAAISLDNSRQIEQLQNENRRLQEAMNVWKESLA